MGVAMEEMVSEPLGVWCLRKCCALILVMRFEELPARRQVRVVGLAAEGLNGWSSCVDCPFEWVSLVCFPYVTLFGVSGESR